jgi:chromosome partitioning protein
MFNIFNKSEKEVTQGKGRIVALMNQKGGVGKTTMAFNVAHALAHEGHKVLCIDMDPQANLSTLFEVEFNQQKYSIFNLLVNSVKELKNLHTDAMLTDCLVRKGNIDLLPSAQDLSGFELTVAGINFPRQLILKKFIEKNDLTHLYDYIVIDGPPTLGLLVVNILCAVNGVLFPFIPDSFSEQGLKNIHQAVEDVEDMGITDAPKILGYIPNLFEKRRKQANEDFNHIKEELGGGKVFGPFYNKANFARSMASKKSVFEFEAMEYKQLQGQFMEVANFITSELQ